MKKSVIKDWKPSEGALLTSRLVGGPAMILLINTQLQLGVVDATFDVEPF